MTANGRLAFQPDHQFETRSGELSNLDARVLKPKDGASALESDNLSEGQISLHSHRKAKLHDAYTMRSDDHSRRFAR